MTQQNTTEKRKLTYKQFAKEQRKAFKLMTEENIEIDEDILKQHYSAYLENEEWKY